MRGYNLHYNELVAGEAEDIHVPISKAYSVHSRSLCKDGRPFKSGSS